MSGIYTTVCAYIPVEIVQALDKRAEEMQVSRSNMIRRILKEYVEEENGKENS